MQHAIYWWTTHPGNLNLSAVWYHTICRLHWYLHPSYMTFWSSCSYLNCGGPLISHVPTYSLNKFKCCISLYLEDKVIKSEYWNTVLQEWSVYPTPSSGAGCSTFREWAWFKYYTQCHGCICLKILCTHEGLWLKAASNQLSSSNVMQCPLQQKCTAGYWHSFICADPMLAISIFCLILENCTQAASL